MKFLTIGLIGTDEIYDIERCRCALKEVIGDIFNLCANNYEITFVISGLNEFSIIAASIIRTFRKNMKPKRCYIELCLPYKTARYKENRELYHSTFDSICFAGFEYCKTYCKATVECNIFMMNRCDFSIFYYEALQAAVIDTKKIADEQKHLYLDISGRGFNRDILVNSTKNRADI